jgi:hypothetical protein
VNDVENVDHVGCQTPSEELVLTWEPLKSATVGLIDQ